MNTDNNTKELTKEQVAVNTTKPQRRYLNKDTFKGGKVRLYSCDVLTGKLEKVVPKKEYRRNTKTNVIQVFEYIEPTPNLFYLTAKNSQEAKELFERQFKEMAEKLEAQENENGESSNNA